MMMMINRLSDYTITFRPKFTLLLWAANPIVGIAAKFKFKSPLLRTLAVMFTIAWSRVRPHRKSKVLLPYKDLEVGRPQLMWTLSTAPTWEVENVIIIVIIVVVVVVVVGNDTYYWVYLSSDHPCQVYYKVRHALLQSAKVCFYKVRQF